MLSLVGNGNGNGKNGSVSKYANSTITGLVAGFAIDALVEALNIPFLDDVPRSGVPFVSQNGDNNLSNVELFLYGISLITAGGGLYSLLTKNQLAGIKPEMFFFGTGLGAGTAIYESNGAQWLGFRK